MAAVQSDDDRSSADAGVWRGRSVARRFTSPDGWVVLVGRTAADNDLLTCRIAAPNDISLHIAGESGSHVVVRNPQNAERLPRATLHFAAGLAVGYSKARRAGRMPVHVARCADVHKPRGSPAGQVTLRRHSTVHATPIRDERPVPPS